MLPLMVTLLLAAVPVSTAPSFARTAKPSVPPALPAPRAVWQIPGWIPGESTFDGVQAATERMLVVGVTNRRAGSETVSRRVVVLNRSRENVQRTYEAESITLRDQSIRATWRVLGSAAARRGNTFAYPQIVMERQLLFIGAYPSAARTETEFYSMDETGRIQWQYPPDSAASGTAGIVSGAPLFGGLLPVRAFASDTLVLWDAQTGVPIDQATPAGKAAIAGAIQQVGSPLLQVGDKWYRVDTGRALPMPYKISSSSDEQIVPLGITADRAFWQVGGDDGFMGHSSWPTYLIASDENGKLLWHFPDAKDSDYLNGGNNAPSASSLTLVNSGGGDAIAVVPTGGRDSALYGLRARDGKKLWKRALPTIYAVAAQDRNAGGVFVLRVPLNAKTKRAEVPMLEYLNATSGKTQKQWGLPQGVERISAAGDDLLAVGANGKVRIYSCRQLLGLPNANTKSLARKAIK